MLDLAYVLLVTFIILTTASIQGVRVESPKTLAAQSLSKPQTRAITITRDGAVYLDAYPVSIQQHPERRGSYKAGNPALPGWLKAEEPEQYQKVTEVLEVANKLYFFFSSRRRHTRWNCDWSSDVCSSD